MSQIFIPPIEDLLLHRENMLMLDSVIAFTCESSISEYTPRNNTWYVDTAGNMPAWAGIELMAQAIAAYVGLLKRSQNMPPKQGVLLGTRQYKATVPSFTANIKLQIHINMVYQDVSGLGAYDCMIQQNNKTLATATLKVFEPDNFETFIQGNIA